MVLSCSNCKRICSESWLFCSGCGSNLHKSATRDDLSQANATLSSSWPRQTGLPPAPVVASVTSGAEAGPQRPSSFSAFMMNRKKDIPLKGKKQTNSRKTKSENVKVNVVLVYRNTNGALSGRRGSSLPVEVSRRSGASFLKHAAQCKHATFNKNYVNLEKEYVLLYKDQEEVINLPGTNQPFSLERYQELTGKLFHRLTFLLCEKYDFEVSSSDDDFKDSDEEMKHNESSGVKETFEVLGDSTGEVTFNFGSKIAKNESKEITMANEPTSSTAIPGSSTPSMSRVATPYATYCDIMHIESDESEDENPSTAASGEIRNCKQVSNENETIEERKSTLKTIIASLQLRSDEFINVRIRRKNLWEDTVRFLKKTPIVDKQLQIYFIGEEAADGGGPRREFFTLLIHKIANEEGLLHGAEGKKLFTMNPLLLESKTYYHAGRMVAAAIQHDGPGLQCLHPAMYSLVSGQPCYVDLIVDEIPCSESKEKLKQLENADSSTFKERVMSAAEFLIECGLSKLDWKYNEKDALVRCLCHYFLNKSKAALDQFVDGIRSNKDVFESIQANPREFALLFTSCNKATFKFADIKDLCKFSFSPVGSNNRIPEEATAYWWEEMLDSLDTEVPSFTAGDLLMFMTGSKDPPMSGFGKLVDIEFYSQEGGRRLPYSSTCALSLCLPRGISSQEEMKEVIEDAVLQGVGFGKV